MKKKIVTFVDDVCNGCGRGDVPYHSKGKCRTCYMKEYRKRMKGKKKVSTAA